MSQYKILFIVSITLLCSCKQDTIYRQKLDINSNYWRYNDSLKFSFEIADTSLKYSIELDVMHRDSFPFENCYVQIKSTYPDKKVKSDMLSLEFADETGKWLGKSKGENLLVPIALQPIAKFKDPGHYEMTFFQNTRVDSLPGILSLEMIIQKLK